MTKFLEADKGSRVARRRFAADAVPRGSAGVAGRATRLLYGLCGLCGLCGLAGFAAFAFEL